MLQISSADSSDRATEFVALCAGAMAALQRNGAPTKTSVGRVERLYVRSAEDHGHFRWIGKLPDLIG